MGSMKSASLRALASVPGIRAIGLREPSFVIAGTGRSGSGTIARLFTAAGVRCGHEDWWTAQGGRRPWLAGDSSWVAVSSLDSYTGRILHQTRNPAAVAASLLNGQLPWSDPDTTNPFYREKARHLDLVGDPALDVLQYMAVWLEIAERHSALTWRLEDLDPDLLVTIAEAAGHRITKARAIRAFTQVPANYNQHRSHDSFSWNALPACAWKDKVEAFAVKWDYPLDG